MAYWWSKNWNCLRTVDNSVQLSSTSACSNRNGTNLIEIKDEWRDFRRRDMKRTDVTKEREPMARTAGLENSRPLVRSLMFCNAAVCVVLQQHQYHSSLTAPCLSTSSLSLSHSFSHYLLPFVVVELNFLNDGSWRWVIADFDTNLLCWEFARIQQPGSRCNDRGLPESPCNDKKMLCRVFNSPMTNWRGG